MGSLEATKEGVEEAAAIALIQVLKKTYMFEIDDMNLMERVKSEYKNEQLEKRELLSTIIEKRQSERIKRLTKCCNQLLDDMDFVQEACDDICGAAVVTLSVHQRSGPLTDMIYSVDSLYEWTEQKIYENTESSIKVTKQITQLSTEYSVKGYGVGNVHFGVLQFLALDQTRSRQLCK